MIDKCIKQPLFKAKSNLSMPELDERNINHVDGWVYGVPMDGVMLNGILECNNEYVNIETWTTFDEETLEQIN